MKHTFQLDLLSSKKFATELGEAVSEAIWSNFESIVLHEVRSGSGSG